MSRRGHQTWNAALTRHHSSRNLGETKLDALPRDNNVTITDKFCPAAKAYPVHGSDEWFGERPSSGNCCEARVSCGKGGSTLCGF